MKIKSCKPNAKISRATKNAQKTSIKVNFCANKRKVMHSRFQPKADEPLAQKNKG